MLEIEDQKTTKDDQKVSQALYKNEHHLTNADNRDKPGADKTLKICIYFTSSITRNF